MNDFNKTKQPQNTIAVLWEQDDRGNGICHAGRMGGLKIRIIENTDRSDDRSPSHFIVAIPETAMGMDGRPPHLASTKQIDLIRRLAGDLDIDRDGLAVMTDGVAVEELSKAMASDLIKTLLARKELAIEDKAKPDQHTETGQYENPF